LTYNVSYGQDIPSDSIILRKIFGKTDKNGITYSYKYDGEINIFSYQDSVVYRVVFRSKITLDNRNLIITILEAPYGTQHGHQFGFQDIYLFESIKGQLETVNSFKTEDIYPIGDVSEFEIVEIGKNKNALISTFQSTGNHHFQNTKDFTLIELNGIKSLFSLTIGYDNSFCKPAESENDSCEAKRFEKTYEILKANSEWYNIKVHHKEFGFTKGCRESFIKEEYDEEYIFNDGKYVEKK